MSDGEPTRARDRELALLIESVVDYAIFLVGPDGRVRTWNLGAQRLKGYTEAEIVGSHLSVFYTPEDREAGRPQRVLETARRDGRFEDEGWRVRKDGSRFWANVTVTAIREQGRLAGFAKVTRDLTMRREAEERLRAVNSELDRFASVAAHDLTEPLHTIGGFAQLLVREELSPQGREFLDHLLTTADRMQRLLQSLLQYARSGTAPAPPEPVALSDCVRHVLADITAAVTAREAVVEVAVPAEARVCATASDVEVVLRNLVSNALKFGAPEAPHVRVEAEPAGERWRIWVTDNGPGVAEADRERIFGPFERAHPELAREGSGLGLAICERLVRRHGGDLGVETAAGQGSRFWVLLPAPDATS